MDILKDWKNHSTKKVSRHSKNAGWSALNWKRTISINKYMLIAESNNPILSFSFPTLFKQPITILITYQYQYIWWEMRCTYSPIACKQSAVRIRSIRRRLPHTLRPICDLYTYILREFAQYIFFSKWWLDSRSHTTLNCVIFLWLLSNCENVFDLSYSYI